ncbi:hypothetical protein CEY11_21445 [Candidimonas nitroreducens]|uniref:Uncharacterized protein n=2 Tax=Candidimonas nitroreducens TaxID=683354 RepID=A0A225M1S6_9BURK|nr:hypothetical protein CEY11_21445 [Candidimonas nitroreducens]
MFDGLKPYAWLIDIAATLVIAAGCFFAGYHVRSLSAQRDAAKLTAGLATANSMAQATARQADAQYAYITEKADHDYQALVDSTATQVSTLSDTAQRLQQRLSAAKRARAAASHSAAGGSIDGTGTDWISGFAACAASYQQLATDDARRADKINGLQLYVKGVLQVQGAR